MTSTSLGFLGAGTLACALAPALHRCGHSVTAIASRTFADAQALAERIAGATAYPAMENVLEHSKVVFLTVPDGAIARVAASLPWRSGLSVVHCSGVQSLDPLETARQAGADVGAFHPLQTLAHAGRPDPFRGASFAVEASSDTLAHLLTRLAKDLGGTATPIPGPDKPLYHASAVIASNYLVTLLEAAAALWPHIGSTREHGLHALLPLVRGTVDNLEAIGFPDALTGPISRGDVETVQIHLQALRAGDPQLMTIYCTLGKKTVDLAREKGRINPETAKILYDVLSVPEGEMTEP